MEPENRLVARTLEKNWEAALCERQQLMKDYQEFQRTQPLTLSDEQRELIRHLAEDIPALWASPTTTPQDRQQIVRMLIERIELNIRGDTEQTEITLFWHGGFTSRHHLSRTVMSYSQSSSTEELIARMVQLRESGLTLKQVAARLNQEGMASLRGCPFTNFMVSRLLVKRGIHIPPGRKRPDDIPLDDHEWWLPDLADVLQMPRTTLSHWYTIGWVRGRKLPGLRGRLILWADAAELERLKQLRNTRRRWSDCPYPENLTTPNPNPKSCSPNRNGT